MPVGSRLASRRPHARRLDARPAAPAARPGRAHRGRRPLGARDVALQRHGRRRGRARVRRELRLRPRRSRRCRRRHRAGRPRRLDAGRGRRHPLPERHGHHARRRDVDRGGELRRLPDGVRRRRRRRALEPPAVGEARRRGAGRDLPRRRRCDLVRVPVDRSRPARPRGRRGHRRGASEPQRRVRVHARRGRPSHAVRLRRGRQRSRRDRRPCAARSRPAQSTFPAPASPELDRPGGWGQRSSTFGRPGWAPVRASSPRAARDAGVRRR